MPWGRYLLGYNGCDKELAKSVAASGRGMKTSQNDHDWLGHGLYFWEDSPKRALQWAKEKS